MEALAQEAKNSKYLKISLEQVQELLDNCQLLVEHDTMVSDKIRLFLCGETYLVQEKTDKDDFLLRAFETELQARQFIMERMKIYEDMWDGCGCKVYYYD
ncbi:MAG TPA: hypothetical protein ENL21_02240 [Caldithrix abyssi]|uniref:Uncharacterized protein n=1 Tax=Caldithrix abyssi TaxID=187145 RepID=A0A7V5H2Q5_CALAY|nr:hypothetical protein [Caldisericaceae bacterium]HHE54572.1 hypothetical protein [Caldithrix abyssi]